ncbi:MAG: class I SAM-dependent methyltransferase [Candidatus Dormibacteria bacterium]
MTMNDVEILPSGNRDFDTAYLEGTAPWDIGRPQPVFQGLMESGTIAGRVLDAGCGSGEHTLMAAAAGHDALGIDASPIAIDLAQKKAAERQVAARFQVWDALDLGALNESFDTVIDSGLFHVFPDAERALYVASLHTALRPGGRVLLMCFSDQQPGDWGPRRVTQAEIRAAFRDGWTVESIEAAAFTTRMDEGPALAWLAKVVRA